MSPRGKLIALEGIDGSGKRTQLDLLAAALDARGFSTFRISFPRYESSFGKLVARYLNGEFGSLETVDPHLSALLYAGDRLEAKAEIQAELAAGKIVLADRYVGSNLAHQSARLPPEQREEFFVWLKNLEYILYGLPVEDLIIYLRVPAIEAHRLVGMKAARAYTPLRRDIQEADLSHLKQTLLIYDWLGGYGNNWACIDCTNAESGVLLAPGEIHRRVLEVVESRVFPPGRART